jgi:hypothetical protein
VLSEKGAPEGFKGMEEGLTKLASPQRKEIPLLIVEVMVGFTNARCYQ